MIKFIFFDIGGVVVKDFSRTNKWEELKRDLGINSDNGEDFDRFFDSHENEICVGESVESLVPLIKEKFGLTFEDGYSFLQDFVDRFEKNESIASVFSSIPHGIRIGLLTNMYPGMLDAIKKKMLMPDVNWDVIIDSSVEKMRKPQKEIFELAQKRAGVSPEEILFVDNDSKHIDAAKEMGWKTFLYDSSDYVKSSVDLTVEISKIIF